MRYVFLIMATAWIAAGMGCAGAADTTELTVAGGRYGATFDAVRQVLRDERFELERVDATEGVITTRPRYSSGLVTPWDGVQSTLGQEAEDLLNNQRRVVRVTFEEAGGEGDSSPPPTAAPVDLRTAEEPLVMRVRVVVLRDYKPGWRVNTTSVRLSTHTVDPELVRRGMSPDYETAVDEDRLLAARVVRRVAEVVGGG